ncbi:MAG: LacI family DNA-binding transcriptional regulator [Woeseia sp.]
MRNKNNADAALRAASTLKNPDADTPPRLDATLSDVARLAGVSPKTVSRVVNREPHVTAGTRERVEDAIASLDYRPNEYARFLRSQRSSQPIEG